MYISDNTKSQTMTTTANKINLKEFKIVVKFDANTKNDAKMIGYWLDKHLSKKIDTTLTDLQTTMNIINIHIYIEDIYYS